MSTDTNGRVLLVVDVQNDFCPGGSLAVGGGDEVVEVINRISPAFARIVATQDWHPRGHLSFASSHPGRKPLETVEVGGVEQVLWPDHCVQGTHGAALHPRLDSRGAWMILRKGIRAQIDSYSAFFENDRATSTGLAPCLRGLGIGEVLICGLATDYCVLASALDGVSLGFSVALVQDACRGVDSPPGSVEKALERMRKAGVRFVASAELC